MLDELRSPERIASLEATKDFRMFTRTFTKVSLEVTRDLGMVTNSFTNAYDDRLSTSDSTWSTVRLIVLDIARDLQSQQSATTNNQRLLLTCLCKILNFHAVPIHEIVQMFPLRKTPSEHMMKTNLNGVTWANQLLESLFLCGWGHRALDLVLACKSKPLDLLSTSIRYTYF